MRKKDAPWRQPIGAPKPPVGVTTRRWPDEAAEDPRRRDRPPEEGRHEAARRRCGGGEEGNWSKEARGSKPQRRPEARSERKGQGNWSKEARGSAKQAARSKDGTSQDEAQEKEEAQQESEQEPISSSTTTHSTVRKLGMTSTRGLRSAVFGRRRRSSPWRDQLKPCEALD